MSHFTHISNDFLRFYKIQSAPRLPFWEPGSLFGTPLGLPRSLLSLSTRQIFAQKKVAHTAGTEADFSQNVDGMKVAHTAGTETEFSKNVDGMKVAHTAGTEAHRSNLKQSSSLFEADGAARRNARSD